MNIASLTRPIQGLLKKLALTGLGATSLLLAVAGTAQAQQHVGTIFYILLENRNFTNGGDPAGGAPLVGSAAAPYINSLITPNSSTSAQVSYCTAYHNVLATPGPGAPSIHPSEPNYVWFENGNNLSKADDNDPYGTGMSVQQIANFLAANPSISGQNLTGLLQSAGVTWRSYQEGTDLVTTISTNSNTAGGSLITATPEPQANWTVPLVSFSGSNVSYTNPYNGSHQWNFAVKHDGSLFFPDTNGSTVTTANTSTTNPFSHNYGQLRIGDQNIGAADWGTVGSYTHVSHRGVIGQITGREIDGTGDRRGQQIGDGDCLSDRVVAAVEDVAAGGDRHGRDRRRNHIGHKQIRQVERGTRAETDSS